MFTLLLSKTTNNSEVDLVTDRVDVYISNQITKIAKCLHKIILLHIIPVSCRDLPYYINSIICCNFVIYRLIMS